jgi:hypothetical protein
MNKKISRRTFLGTAATTAAFTVFSNHAIANVLVNQVSNDNMNKNTLCYYISTKGNDANDGLSPDKAWATIAKANQATLAPGCKILFEGGGVYRGSFHIGPNAGGDAKNPVFISSYGTGRATIDSGDEDGIVIEESTGVTVININVAGSGRNINVEKIGVKLIKSKHIVIDHVEIWGFQLAGIMVWGGSEHVRITNVYAHDNGYCGICTGYRDNTKAINRFIYIGYCRTNNNQGVSDRDRYIGDQSGSGINIQRVENGLVEFCESAYNGRDSYHTDNNGPVGIWLTFCKHVTVQFCISHHNDSYNSDGGGFDFDSGCKSCILQFNYSYRNKGCGYLLCAWNSSETHKLENCTMRYCISENDSWHDDHAAGIFIWNGDVQSMNVYNNVIYNEAGRGCLRSRKSNPEMRFFNNIFILWGNGRFISEREVATEDLNLTIQNNCYWRLDGGGRASAGSFAGCDSLEAFRKKFKHEMLDGKPVGIYANPLLQEPGADSGLTDPTKLPEFLAYRIQDGSACIAKGLNLRKRFGISTGEMDFFGNMLPADGNCNIGLHQTFVSSLK